MHPKRDHREIVYTIACSEFSFDAARAMELAFFRTFAVPSISKVLYDTGKFLHATQCRIDDTDILLSEILESGYDGPRASGPSLGSIGSILSLISPTLICSMC